MRNEFRDWKCSTRENTVRELPPRTRECLFKTADSTLGVAVISDLEGRVVILGRTYSSDSLRATRVFDSLVQAISAIRGERIDACLGGITAGRIAWRGDSVVEYVQPPIDGVVVRVQSVAPIACGDAVLSGRAYAH